MARTLLQQKQKAINALREKLLKIDAEKNPTKYANTEATLRRLERTLAKKPTEAEQEDSSSTLVSGLTGSQWRSVFEAESVKRGGEPKATSSQEVWLRKEFPGEDTATDPAFTAEAK